MSVSITQNLSSAWCLWAEHCSVVAGCAWGITGQQFLLWPSLAPQHLYSETQSGPLCLLPRLSKHHYSIFVLLHTKTLAMTFKCPISWDTLWAKSWPCQVTGTAEKQQGPCTVVSTFFLPFLFLFCRPVMCHQHREKGWIPWQCSGSSSSSSGLRMDLTGQLALPEKSITFWWAHRQSSETEIPFATICCCCPFFKDLVKAR